MALLAATLLVAANLRVAVASVPPLLVDIRQAFGLSLVEAALLTSAPLLCFGLLAPVAAVAVRRHGVRRALGLALGALTAGLALRLVPSAAALFAGTVAAGAGVAVANVLLPALVKDAFRERMGLVTGLYTTAMGLAAALAAGLSAPLAAISPLGWRLGLGIWLVPCAAALGVWLRLSAVGAPAPVAKPTAEAQAPPALPSWRGVLADRVAQRLTLFMGLQSVGYYALLSWLPALFESHGLSATEGGLLLSVQGLVGMPLGLLLPAVVHRLRDQRPLVAGVSLLTLAGFAGLAFAPMRAPVLWVVVVGLGQGATFPLALTLIGLRTRRPDETAVLSTFVQSGGYLLASAGPLALALLRQASGGWTLPFAALAALTLVQTVGGVGVAGGRYAFEGGLGRAPAAGVAPAR